MIFFLMLLLSKIRPFLIVTTEPEAGSIVPCSGAKLINFQHLFISLSLSDSLSFSTDCMF